MVNEMSPDDALAALKRLGATHQRIADMLGIERTMVTKMFSGKRRVQTEELPLLSGLVADLEREAGEHGHLVGGQPTIPSRDYVNVEVLPTFAGMGGGGTGDGERSLAMISRELVEDQLKARPSDVLMINVRGDSMEPIFMHDDQLLIDCRDRNPVQPGPFALWDGDGYVVKNVERRRGRYRVFSANPAYSEQEYEPEEVQIMGRPVWFARRL